MVPTAKDLLSWHLEGLEEDFNQVGPVEVVEVLLAEVSFISSLHPAYDQALLSFESFLCQLMECLLRNGFQFFRLNTVHNIVCIIITRCLLLFIHQLILLLLRLLTTCILNL